MKVDVVTLFPDMFGEVFNTSMLKKAQDDKIVKIDVHNLRKWTKDKHKTVDGRPYGGGPGMILRIDVIDKALQALKSNKSRIILTSAKGKTFNQARAQKLSKEIHLIVVAGHYEGVDQRVHDHLVDQVISIGDYVLTGGEIPAMVIVDSIVRLIPGVLNPDSLKEESHSPKSKFTNQQSSYVEYPQYTRPEDYKGWKVPEVLLSGNHKEIERWRKEQS